MLEGILNAGQQEMAQQAPAPMAPMSQQQEAPGQSVDFDINQNPQDRQFMTDAMMYAPMLRGMDPEQRKEKWPEMVKAMGQVSPKASAMFDPTLPPSDQDLEALMSRMPGNKEAQVPAGGMQLASAQDDFMQEQVKRQLRGEKPQSQIEYNAQRAGEDQKTKETENLNKQLQTASLQNSDEELIFKGSLLTGQGSKYMTADSGTAAVDSMFGDDDASRTKGAPAGYRWKDTNQKELEPIPNGPQDPAVKQASALAKRQGNTAPTTGQVALAKTAMSLMPNIIQGPWDDNYDYDLKAMTAAQSGIKPRWTSIAIGDQKATKADIYNQALAISSEANLKLATGAAATTPEAKKYEDMFRCTAGDNADSCLNKVITAKIFTQNLADLLKDDSSTPTGKNIDPTKVQSMINGNAATMYKYKGGWKDRAMKANPGASSQDLDRLWVKEMINNPEFASKVLSEAKE